MLTTPPPSAAIFFLIFLTFFLSMFPCVVLTIFHVCPMFFLVFPQFSDVFLRFNYVRFSHVFTRFYMICSRFRTFFNFFVTFFHVYLCFSNGFPRFSTLFHVFLGGPFGGPYLWQYGELRSLEEGDEVGSTLYFGTGSFPRSLSQIQNLRKSCLTLFVFIIALIFIIA